MDDALRGVQATENTPPLFYAMAWICDRLFADLKLIRLPALLAGTALIPVTALVAKRVYGTPAALLCAALAALSPFAIYYSSEARAYAPAALAVTCSTLALLRALDHGARGWWAAFAVSTAAAMWLHYTAVFPLAAQAAWALAAAPDQRRDLLLWLIVALLLYAPWLPFAGSNVPIELIGVLQDFAAVQVLEYPLRSIVGYPYLDLSYVPGTWELVALGAALAVATAMLARGPHRFRSLDLLLVGLAASAPLGLTAYTLLRTNILLPRNVFVSAPALMVLTAGLVARRQPRVAVPVAVAIVALLVWPAWRTGFGDLRRAPVRRGR